MGFWKKATNFVKKIITAPIKIITKAFSWLTPQVDIPDYGTTDLTILKKVYY